MTQPYSLDFDANGAPFMVPIPPRPLPLDRSKYPGAYDLPVRTSGRPMQLPRAGLGDAAEDQQKAFKRAVMESALKTCALQTGISVVLSATIIGAAIAGLMSLAGLFLSRKYKKQTDDAVAAGKARLQALGASYNKKNQALQYTAAEEEYPAAQAMAVSGIPLDDESPAAVAAAQGTVKLAADDGVEFGVDDGPLEVVDPSQVSPASVDGLGNVWVYLPERTVRVDLGPTGLSNANYQAALGSWFSNVTNVVRRVVAPVHKLQKAVLNVPGVRAVVKPATRVLEIGARVKAEMTVRPAAIIGKGLLRSGSLVFKLTGNQKQAAKWRNAEKQWDRRCQWAIKKTASDIAKPDQIPAEVRKGFRTLTGADIVDTINAKMAAMYDKAKAKLEAEYQRQVKVVASPEYRAELRLQLARSIRDTPARMAEAMRLAGKDQDLANLANTGKIEQAGKTSIFAPLAAIGGIVAMVAINK